MTKWRRNDPPTHHAPVEPAPAPHLFHLSLDQVGMHRLVDLARAARISPADMLGRYIAFGIGGRCTATGPGVATEVAADHEAMAADQPRR